MDDHNKKYDLINKTYKILDDGFIRVVDLMGDDSAIVQAARISYGKGTKSVSDDRSLIRYLLRNKHTSCFEMAVIKFHIRMPLDVMRQWCLTGDTLIDFDRPNSIKKNKFERRTISVQKLFDIWQPNNNAKTKKTKYRKRKKIEALNIRSVDEITGEIKHTHIKDIWSTGKQEVFQLTLKNGKSIKTTDNHRIYTDKGYLTLSEIKNDKNIKIANINREVECPFQETSLKIDLANETWKDVNNEFKNYYQVSNLGRVRNKNTKKLRKILLRGNGNYKRPMIRLFGNGLKDKEFRVCTLVLEAFDKKRPINMVCRHLDGNATNNNIKNLVWGTIKENIEDKKIHKRNDILKLTFTEIDSIISQGIQETYDIEVVGPNYNFSANQIIVHNCRHRTWNFISINEYSTRYSEAIDVKMKTEDSKWRKQSTDNKQGSDGYLSRDIGIYLTDQEKNLHKLSEEVYQTRLNNGVAREQARKDLPLSTYTEFYVKIDLHNLLHFCSLRSDLHAQEEIRMYSNTILEEIIKEWCPLVYEAYNDYVKSAKTLFGYEMEIIKLICSGKLYDAKSKAIELGLISFKENGELKKNREREEFEDKLRYMGILIPWNDLKTN